MFANVSVGLAILAGLASFLSPCVLSLVPAYIGYLGGSSANSDTLNNSKRWLTFKHGLGFVLGFSLVFILLGVVASSLGGLLYDLRYWITKIGGIVVVFFGLHMTGIIRISFLEYDFRKINISTLDLSFLTSILMGIFFSAGWSPCVGPVLGAILTLALNGGNILNGILLLAAYSFGLAIPFLFAALGLDWVIHILRRYGKVMRYIEIFMGFLLIILGTMLFFGTFERLARFGFFIDFGL